ncbi:MAG: caspase family protein [Hyphomicrobiaceae bacterium]
MWPLTWGRSPFGYAALALALLAVAPAASAEKRVALVIGNGNYAKVGKLPNPVRDAAAIEALLRTAGFDAVEVKRDLGRGAMRRALRDFSDWVRDADIAVVFYAGTASR